MGFAELTDKIGVKDRVDFLALELCNMGGHRDRLSVAAG